MTTELIVRKTNNGEFVEVVKVYSVFPEPSYFRVTIESGVVLEHGTAEDALRVLAKYML